jgi:prepilin-type N-terminal cleavage/methylation domain-containing protein
MLSCLRLRRAPKLNSFTLIELLTVIAIIAILAALTLVAGEGVMKTAARSRAHGEIQAMATALEGYKNDNGIYPIGTNFSNGTNDYPTYDGSTLGGPYQESAQVLYEALTSKTNFLDNPVAGAKAYMTFKANQLGNTTTPAGTGYAATASTYVQDPYGYSYGYYTGAPLIPPATTQNDPPYAGTGFFDLWSTGGSLATTTGGVTNSWVANWLP